jgi:hypothetical protein
VSSLNYVKKGDSWNSLCFSAFDEVIHKYVKTVVRICSRNYFLIIHYVHSHIIIIPVSQPVENSTKTTHWFFLQVFRPMDTILTWRKTYEPILSRQCIIHEKQQPVTANCTLAFNIYEIVSIDYQNVKKRTLLCHIYYFNYDIYIYIYMYIKV